MDTAEASSVEPHPRALVRLGHAENPTKATRLSHQPPLMKFILSPRRVVVSLFLILLAAAAHAAEVPEASWAKLAPHPRLFANAARWAALKQQVKTDPVSEKFFTIIRAGAEYILTQPPVAFVDTGAFLLGPMVQSQRRITTLAFAYRLEGDPRFLARAKQEMTDISKVPYWYPHHFIDTAEGAIGLALGLDWLYHDLSETERDMFATALIGKALRASVAKGSYSDHWHQTNTNHNSIGHGDLAVAALAVAEREPALARTIVNRSITDVRFFAETYAPVGAYPEGPNYWGSGTNPYVILIEIVRYAFGTTADLEKFPGFLQSPDALMQQTGPSGLTFNYADAQAGRRTFTLAMFWLARELRRGDLVLEDLATIDRWYAAVKNGKYDMSENGQSFLPLALIFWDPKLAGAQAPTTRPLNWSTTGMQPVAAMRTAWDDPRATFVALKGGRLPESHAHMDVGSFVLEADGVRWAVDPTAENYRHARANGIQNRDLFDTVTPDSKRWGIFRNGPDGHNILRFDGKLQEPDGKAEIFPAKKAGATAYQVDLTPIYKRQVRAVRRGFSLQPDHSIVIQDEWQAGAEPVAASWQWLTHAQVTKDADGLLLKQDGQSLRLRVAGTNVQGIDIEDVSKPRKPFDSPNPGLNRIVIRLRTEAGKDGRLVVVAQPQGRPTTSKEPAIVPLGEW